MKMAFAFLCIMLLTAVANLLMKTGIMEAPARTEHWLAVLNWRVFFGLAALGLAAFVYLWLLRWLPLYLVQSFGAAQFVAVVLVSALVLKERIQPGQWLGIVFIAAGIAIVAFASKKVV